MSKKKTLTKGATVSMRCSEDLSDELARHCRLTRRTTAGALELLAMNALVQPLYTEILCAATRGFEVSISMADLETWKVVIKKYGKTHEFHQGIENDPDRSQNAMILKNIIQKILFQWKE